VQPHDLDQLLAALAGARDSAAAQTGRIPNGVRLVEPSARGDWYLCAVEETAFLCLDAQLAVETDARNVHRVAGCVLLVEHAESLIDAAELAVIGSLAGRIGAQLDEPGVQDALGDLTDAAAALAVWRDAPARAIASLPQLEVGIRLHDLLRAAWERFVESSDPLVARQDDLPGDAVDALRDLEQAAGRAGAHRSVAAELAEAITAIDAGADEIVARHLTPLGPDDAAV